MVRRFHLVRYDGCTIYNRYTFRYWIGGLLDMGKLVYILGCEAPLVDSGGTRECPRSSLWVGMRGYCWNYCVFKFIGGF